MSRTFLIAFPKKEQAETFLKVVEIHYAHCKKMELLAFKQKLLDSSKIEHTFYWVCCKLGFNMGIENFSKKMGKTLDHCKFFMLRTIPENIEEDEEVLNSLKSILQTLYENESGFTTLEDLINNEHARSQYNNNNNEGSATKKRKINFD